MLVNGHFDFDYLWCCQYKFFDFVLLKVKQIMKNPYIFMLPWTYS